MNIWIVGVILVLVASGGYAYVSMKDEEDMQPSVSEEVPVENTEDNEPEDGGVQVDAEIEGGIMFSGTLEKVHEGCYVDAECYVVVDGKHVTVMMGWRNEEAGSVQGVSDFGALTERLGARIEVYARENGEGRYTLYGSKDFYIRVVK